MRKKLNIRPFTYVKKSTLLIYLIAAPLSILASTAFAMSLQPVMDAGLSGAWEAFIKASALAVLFGAGDILASFLEKALQAKILTQYTWKLRCHYFERVLGMETEMFYKNGSADYLSKLTTDGEAISEKYLGSILNIYMSLWSLAMSVTAICLARWEMAVYVVVFSIISVNLPKLFQGKANTAEKDYLEKSKAHISTAQDGLNNFLLIRLYSLMERQMGKYRSAAKDLATSDYTRQKKQLSMNMAALGISELSFVLIIIFAMYLVLMGKLSVGYTMSISQLLGGIMAPFESLPGDLLSYRTGKTVFETNEALLEAAANQNGERSLSISSCSECIRLEKISFSYPQKDDHHQTGNQRPGRHQQVHPQTFGHREVLDHIDLELDMKKKYALVGASGSGKSTLAKIIMGFLTPTSGSVSMNGLPISDVDQQSLYSKVAYQEQKTSFFYDTIKNNILLGSDLSQNFWERLMKETRLSEMLSKLPDKENTVIEENGKNISGGEAQRIGLARCLAKHPDFIILDEVTASLDNRNALELEKMVLSLEGQGALVITHRIWEENMRKYDQIFVLEDGKITEQGTWDELMERKGELFRLAGQGSE